MDLLFLYSKLITASLVGMIVQLLMKNVSLRGTAKVANLQYSFIGFIKRDFDSIVWTFLGVSAVFLIFSDIIKNITKYTPDVVQSYFYGFIFLSLRDIAIAIVTTAFLTLGYMGQDFLLRFLGRTSKELKAAIDYKTTQADVANGTVDKPTPTK